MAIDIERLRTVQLVPLTPFSADGLAVLPEVLGSFSRSLYDAGIRVFLPAAGTGEFHLPARYRLAILAATVPRP